MFESSPPFVPTPSNWILTSRTCGAMKLHQLVVPKAAARLRLDRFLAMHLPAYSRARIQQLIRNKFVTLNDAPARPSDHVRTGDHVDLTEPPPEKIDNQPE